MSLTVLLAVFALGFIIHRDRSVRVAAIVCLLLGVLAANGWLGQVGHTLDGVFSSIT
jgi:predicted RND superfamily exporter protein